MDKFEEIRNEVMKLSSNRIRVVVAGVVFHFKDHTALSATEFRQLLEIANTYPE